MINRMTTVSTEITNLQCFSFVFVWQSNPLGGTLHKKETVLRHLTNKDRANSFQTNVVLHRREQQQQQQNSLLYVQIYIYTYIVEKVQILSLDAKQLGNLRISLKLQSVTTESIKKNRMWTIGWFSVKMKMLKSTAVAGKMEKDVLNIWSYVSRRNVPRLS